MNKLTQSCTTLTLIPPYDCGVPVGNKIVKLIIGKPSFAFGIAPAGDVPTAAEFQTEITAKNLMLIDNVTNGRCEKVGSQEISGHDTVTGGSEEFNPIYGVRGNLKEISDVIIGATAHYNMLTWVKVWYITETNYCFGGTDGYKCTSRGKWSKVIQDGSKARIEFDLQFDATLLDDDYLLDADYETLANAAS